jgi:hypothetical protein
MQMELFDLNVDDRVKNMQTYIKIKLYRTLYWFPDANEIVEIGEKHKVSGRLPLDCFISIAKEYIKFMEENLDILEVEDEDYFDKNAIQDHKKIISFYKKRLNIEE